MQQDAFMRTTLDLPDELLKRAKIAAVERGVTLRELVGRALARDISSNPTGEAKPTRIRLPIFRSRQPGSLELTSADMARAEEEEDRRRHGLPR